MSRFSLSSLLITIGIVSVLLAFAIRFPKPMILLASLAPLLLVLWRVRPAHGPWKELKMIALVSIAVLPPYVAFGPLVTRGSL